MFSSVLVASRGVGACRIARTLRRLGVRVVAVHSEADRFAPHVLMADRALCIGRAPVSDSYLKAEAILDAARVTGVDAIHPGFGYLGDNAEFADAVARLGLGFIGPLPTQIRALTNDVSLRLLAAEAGVPRLRAATDIDRGRRERIVEVQLFGHGDVVALGDRERLLDETGRCVFARSPASIGSDLRYAVHSAATSIGRALRYQSAGSIAFTCDFEQREFFVSGATPGLTAEHAIIEVVTGIDLIEWMVLAAAGVSPDLSFAIAPPGRTAVSAQVFAVDPARNHRLGTGTVTEVTLPNECRSDSGIERGSELGEHCEPHIATLVAVGATRESANDALVSALKETYIGGLETNLDWLRCVAAGSQFESGDCASVTTAEFDSRTFEVLQPGTFSIVVDYPGRIGYWPVGIPPSGPMDDLSLRFANRVVGNAESAACLEVTLSGPTLVFSADAVVALCGAPMQVSVDDVPLDMYRAHWVRAGQTLRCGTIGAKGVRAYLAIRGGIRVAPYLGSLTTFTLGHFGGHGGRPLRCGDVLHVGTAAATEPHVDSITQPAPEFTNDWRIGVLYGPHAAPEFFTERDIEVLFGTDYEVHFNSNRTGVRLIGPKPEWARADGGEAGLHPSNIHDVAYAVGALDFTGDMPIILGPDGPSLGGFVCPATVATAELWKLGQLRAGDRVRFVAISESQAAELRKSQLEALAAVRLAPPTPLVEVLPERAVVARSETRGERVSVTYRRAGDRYLLVEYGNMVLDLRLRFRVHALMTWLEQCKLPGIIELTPGIRSLQIHFDEAVISQRRLLDALQQAEPELPDTNDIDVPSRIVHLPLSWDDPQTRRAIAIYTQSVRPDAPWCPSNIEFIRRINGLDSEKDVYDTVFGATYLVLGLGDVYLGAPVATPIDPRHRLVTTKYNPARTWTPENAVGIGGAYLCIYGMEGPGGYQFVGRTLQVFNRYRKTRHFAPERPWLLRFFDQIRFYPVSAEQLMDQRRDFPYGKCDIDIEEARFSARTHRDFLTENQESIAHFKARQHKAFEEERERWIESGQLNGNATAKTKSRGTVQVKQAAATEVQHD